MKRYLVYAVLLLAVGLTGCSFLMKEYDDRNERQLASLAEENKNLSMKVQTLERKVPAIAEDNQKLKEQVKTLEHKVSYEGETPEPQATGAAKPELAKASTGEAEAGPATTEKGENSEVQPKAEQPKSKLTPEGARLLEIAAKGKSDSAKTEPEAKVSEAKPEAKSEVKPEAGTVKEEAKPVPEPVKLPEPKLAAEKPKLTPEAERLMAMAKGTSAPTAAEKPAAPTAQEKPQAAPAVQKEVAPAPEPPKTAKAEPAAPVKDVAPAPEAPKTTTTQSVSSVKAVTPPSVKIKVLSGTGKIFSAQKMAKTLNDMGYKTTDVALAPRSNFTESIVYYNKGHKETADNIRMILGGKTVAKPLTWNSEFDVIVVSAER